MAVLAQAYGMAQLMLYGPVYKGGFEMEIIGSFIVGLIVLYIILKVLSLPVRIVWKLISNSLIGAVMLWVVNLFGTGIEITFFKALIAGIFGIPGVIVILLAHFL